LAHLENLDWVSANEGWALAAVQCRGKVGYVCPALAHTTDGGHTWSWPPTPPQVASDVHDAQTVFGEYVRFATPMIGYLYGGHLSITTDGGRTWVQQPDQVFPDGPQHPGETGFTAIGPSSGGVVGMTYLDERYQIQFATPGATAWQTVFTFAPQSLTSAVTGTQVVWQNSKVVYVLAYGHPAGGTNVAQTAITRSTDGGHSWTELTDDPCGYSGTTENDAVDLSAAANGRAVVLCQPRNGSTSFFAVTSVDNGSSWGPRLPVPGGAAEIVAPGASDTVVGSSQEDVSFSPDGGQHWQVSHPQSGGSAQWRASRTTDGGLHWTVVQIPSP
jgi:hypothetical protein